MGIRHNITDTFYELILIFLWDVIHGSLGKTKGIPNADIISSGAADDDRKSLRTKFESYKKLGNQPIGASHP